MIFDFFKTISGIRKRDMLNVGLDYPLTLNADKQTGKAKFIKKYNTVPENQVEEYFNLYKEVAAEAEEILSNLYKLYQDDSKGKNKINIELEFKSAISQNYNWLDKMNLNKLYDTICFYLK